MRASSSYKSSELYYHLSEGSHLDIDNEEAKKILQDEWEYVEKHPNASFLDPSAYPFQIQQIKDIVCGGEVTYRYILLTAALSKVANPNVHYRALQKGSKLQGAYDARSVAHQVVVPFEKSHGERFGGSNEPYLNRPARYPEFDMSNRDRNRNAQRRLYDLLEFCQTQSQKDKALPKLFLRQVLKEMMSAPPMRQDFHVPPVQVSLKKTVQIVDEYLAVSGSGERLVAVSAALFSSTSHVTGKQLDVTAYPVNWSDKFAKTAGDIEFRMNGKIVKAAESKDKPILESDVRHCQMKAKQRNLTEYIILNGAGIAEKDTQNIEKFVESQLKEGINIYIMDVPEDFYPCLVFLGEQGRKQFLGKVGEFLNKIRATRENKTAWQKIVDKYLGVK
jgi:hypothetical protein